MTMGDGQKGRLGQKFVIRVYCATVKTSVSHPELHPDVFWTQAQQEITLFHHKLWKRTAKELADNCALKGNQPEHVKLAWHVVHATNIVFCRLYLSALSLFIHNKYFLASNMSSSGHCTAGSLFTSEEQRKVGSWCNWYCCHTRQLALWYHWCRLLCTTWQHSRVKVGFSQLLDTDL